MKLPALTVRSPDPAVHEGAVIDLVSKTFGTYARFKADAVEWYVRHSHYDWEASAIGLHGEVLVAHWGVWGYPMRVGRAVVRCAGVGAVATDANLRRRGLMARTAPHSLERMRARGYHLSVLFGIDGFYDRFGFVAAWPESRWHLRCADLPRTLPRVPGLRRIPLSPTPALVRLHARASAGLTGTAVRPTYPRSWSGMRKDVEAYAWGGAPGRPAGHLIVEAEGAALVCNEASGAPDAALAALAQLCRRKSLPEVRFETLPYGSALAARLRGLTCRYEQRYAPNGEAMVRVVDLAGCLAAMAPELSARLAASPLGGYRGALLVRGPEGTARLELGAGRVKVSAGRGGGPVTATVAGSWPLAQLLLGSDEPLEICEVGRLRLSGDAARLVPVLFPAQHPQLHLADRF